MNVSSDVLYGVATAIGVVGGGAIAWNAMATEGSRRDAYEQKITGMSRDELADAARRGIAPPQQHQWVNGLGVGATVAAVGGTGLLFGAVGNAMIGFGNFAGGGSDRYLSLRPPSTLIAAGLGAIGGALLGAGAYAITHRGD